LEEESQRIIDEIIFQNIRDLEGRVVGLRISLNNDYAQVPSQNLLDEILSRSGELLGELK